MAKLVYLYIFALKISGGSRFFLFFHGQFGKEVCLTDQEYFQQDVKVLYNFVNKTVNVPALPGKAQIFPLADTFVPQDAIPCFLQNNPVCYCDSITGT